jgi:hypothetical protein
LIDPQLAQKYRTTRPQELQEPLPDSLRRPVKAETTPSYDDIDIPAFLREQG